MRTLAQNGIRKCRPLATGQTTSYVDYDDGYYQKGVKKPSTVYIAYSTGQYSGTTAITINSKTDTHTNNCVLDHNTGLMWSARVSDSVGPASNGYLPWTTTGSGPTAEGIFPYVLAANAASLAGWTDWRIPNIFELISLWDFQAPAGGLDSAFNSPNAYIWSSTTEPDDTSRAQGAYTTTANLYNGAKTGTGKAFLVRGG